LGAAGLAPHGGERGLHGRLGGAQSGAAAQVGGGGLPGERVRFLGQVADVQRRRRPLDHAGGRRLQPGEHPQQGGLAGAVAAEHADPAGAVDDQVDRVEHQLGATDDGDAAGSEHEAGLRGSGTVGSALHAGRLAASQKRHAARASASDGKKRVRVARTGGRR